MPNLAHCEVCDTVRDEAHLPHLVEVRIELASVIFYVQIAALSFVSCCSLHYKLNKPINYLL